MKHLTTKEWPKQNQLRSTASCCLGFDRHVITVLTLTKKKQQVAGSHVTRVCFQDVECDVSIEDDNRQEWIFTLYDFDNSGKVTKEVR